MAAPLVVMVTLLASFVSLDIPCKEKNRERKKKEKEETNIKAANDTQCTCTGRVGWGGGKEGGAKLKQSELRD